MIKRYTLPEMGGLWSEQNKFRKWLDVEIAVCEVHAENGIIPPDALAEIKSKAAFTVERINEIEKTTDHDVIAFTTALAENIGESARFVHYGLTSSGVGDTGNPARRTHRRGCALRALRSHVFRRGCHGERAAPARRLRPAPEENGPAARSPE